MRTTHDFGWGPVPAHRRRDLLRSLVYGTLSNVSQPSPMQSIEVPDGSLLLDTDGKITAALLASLKGQLIGGRPIWGFIRYVSLYKVDTIRDVSPDEANLIIDNGYGFGLVQHCLAAPPGRGGWTASPQLGAAKGATAKAHADRVGYPTDSMLTYDNEDVESGDIAGEIGQWVSAIGPRPPLLYTGYSPGLTSRQLWALPEIHCYGGAAGSWDVDECGVAMRQGQTITLHGVEFDPNIAQADHRGRRVVFAKAA